MSGEQHVNGGREHVRENMPAGPASGKHLRPVHRPGRRFRGGPGPHGAHLIAGEKPKDFRGTLKRLLQYLRPRRWRLVVTFFAAIFSTVFSIAGPMVMGMAVTEIFEGFYGKYQGLPGAGVDFAKVGQILLVLAGLYIFSSLFNFIQQFVMAGVAQKTVYDLREDVNKKLEKLPLKYFDSHAHGDTLSRVTNDIDTIGTTLQQSLTQFITAFVTIVGIVIMMLVISPILTIIAVLTLPASMYVIRPILRRSQKYFSVQQRTLGELNGHIEEMYTGHQIVKAFGHEKKAIAKFNEVNERLYEAGWKAHFVSGIIMPVMIFIGNLGYVLIAVIGGIFVTQRWITIGDIQAFITYTKQFTHPVSQTANIANIIQATIAAAERVFELLDEEEEPKSGAVSAPARVRGAVSFKNVDFGYGDKLLIKNLNLEVKPGQTVAIVGPTGAGKTTLINLLMRFYDVKGGAIYIDGVDIRDMPRSELRKNFGMVLQDTWLFNGTIKENLAYGKKDATDEEICRAARLANADHFIRTLPDGYETVLNENASNISQGQKQLLTIARAILADPPIMILDEATSSVDTRTEMAIQKGMARLMKGRTSFVIAHRLSTIRDADLILVMNEGRIVEQGTHRELLRKNGFYAELYNSQFAGGKTAV